MTEPASTKGERTQAAIIAAAHTLFIRQGYHGTSMRQIATEAGIALGGIYNHFESKEAIFAAVLDQHHPYRTFLPLLVEMETQDFETFAYAAAARIQATLREHPEFMNLGFIEMVEFKGRHLPQIFHKIAPQLAQTLQRFNHAPHPLRPVSVPAIMQMFIGMLIAHTINEHLLGGQLASDAAHSGEASGNSLNALVDIFLYGVLEKDKQV